MADAGSWWSASTPPPGSGPSKAAQMYNDPGFQQRSAQFNLDRARALYNQSQGIGGFGAPPNVQQPGPTSAPGLDPNIQAILDALTGGGVDDVTVSTPGGNTLTGSSGRKSGAGSATLAKELQQKLQIMNLDQQQQLIALQQQQDPQLYKNQLDQFNLQQQNLNQQLQTNLQGINSSATASGAYGAMGTQQARDLANFQYQDRTQALASKLNTAQLNEQYNQASLGSQATMNFWERFAQAAQAGFFK